MNPFRSLTRIFIDVFGITHPTPHQEQRATWFISTMLGMILIAVIAAFFAGYRLSHR